MRWASRRPRRRSGGSGGAARTCWHWASESGHHEAAHGSLPTDTAGGERDADAVLRHLAGAEAWLIGRLDPTARYEGPLRDVPVEVALARTRAWLVDQLRVRAAER